jgi:hypothetical protein
VLEPGLAPCREMEIRFALPFVAASLGSAYLSCGRAADAVPLLEEAVAAYSAKRTQLFYSVFITFLAERTSSLDGSPRRGHRRSRPWR